MCLIVSRGNRKHVEIQALDSLEKLLTIGPFLQFEIKTNLTSRNYPTFRSNQRVVDGISTF